MKAGSLTRQEVCSTILKRAHEVAKELEDAKGRGLLEDVDISATQLWEHRNLMVEFKCPSAMVFEAGKIASDAITAYYKLKATVTTKRTKGRVVV